MTDNQSNLSYQDILDKYAESINPSTDSKIPEEKIKPEPELEPINPPETILTPEEEEVVKSQPQPEIQPQPEPQPEPQSEPQPEIQTQPEAPPQIEAPPSPQAINSPPVAEAIISPPPQIELPPESSEISPKKPNHFFKYLFFFSLIIFIVVLVLVVISFLNSQKPVSNSRDIPQNNFSPTSLPTDFCELNNQQYLIGATFTADDGCNTCTCGEDLTVTCTTNTCDLTPTTPATVSGTPTKSATTSAIPTDWKTYSNQIYNVSFKYPNSFSVSDELPKTKTQGGPKTALELTDTKNNYLISIIIDPAGFGPIFADKQITLDYSTSKGLFSSKITPVSKVDEENLLPDKKVLWYQFDSDSFSNITIITNAEKTDTKLETLTNQILSTFKFL